MIVSEIGQSIVNRNPQLSEPAKKFLIHQEEYSNRLDALEGNTGSCEFYNLFLYVSRVRSLFILNDSQLETLKALDIQELNPTINMLQKMKSSLTRRLKTASLRFFTEAGGKIF